jgi:zinc transport system ATP-binding protein
MALIDCHDAAFAYDGQLVLSDVTFTVEAGDYLCIVGENGSGKSTLMKGLLNLVPPVRGAIHLGEGLTRDEIGYLPQQNQSQRDFPASVKEVVQSGIRGNQLFLSKADKLRAAGMLDTLEAEQLKNRSFMELSGGQKQRVLLARALCATHKILLMDEPTAGLDPIVARELYRTIERINREQKIAIIMISHDVGTALLYAKHILHLQQTPVYFGTASDYLQTLTGRQYAGGFPNV